MAAWSAYDRGGHGTRGVLVAAVEVKVEVTVMVSGHHLLLLVHFRRQFITSYHLLQVAYGRFS